MTLALKPTAPLGDPGWSHFSRWNQYRSELLGDAEEWSARRERSPEGQERIARDLCAQLVIALWNSRTQSAHRGWLPPWKLCEIALARRVEKKVQDAARALQGLSVVEAGYLVSSLYTTLLPPEIRSSRGAFYTPPVLAERLIDLVAGEGIDWFSARVLDPACGGGAFLTPLAHRILNDHRVQSLEPEERLLHLEQRLRGIELDEFAAWMSRVFLQLLVYPTSQEAGRPLRTPVDTADALDLADSSLKVDLVIGNPPYGRVSLPPARRTAFARSLYGHANLYGVFLDLALRWRDAAGLVAFVTPTSFLGGQYFSRLRALLIEESPPLAIDIVEARSGVFEAVLQETCLALFGPNPDRTTAVHHLRVSDRAVEVTRAGSFRLSAASGTPWLLPRLPRQALLVANLTSLPTRFHDLGYKASTGPLVWNRHKDQLRRSARSGAYPLIWAEAVRRNRFTFDYKARADVRYVALQSGQEFLIEKGPVVLVQRTTAKEQDRRLVACAVPESFLSEWGGLVVENHVNVLRVIGKEPVNPVALAAVLNTRAVDQVFRCISGSVAVSASELHSLPLPPRELFEEVAALLAAVPEGELLAQDVEREIESLVEHAYGMETA